MHAFIAWSSSIDSTLNIDSTNLNKDWEYVQNRILADVASIIWGKDYYYYVLLNQDVQFQEAINHFEKAKEIMN